MAETLIRSIEINRSPADVFAWHARVGALQRLTPPWESVELISATGGIEDGARVVMRSRVGPFKLRWVAEHFGYEAGKQFCDRQLAGPFSRWEHRHRFELLGPDRCRLVDEIIYALPLAPFSHLAKGSVRHRVNRLFDYRHAVTKMDLETAPGPRGRVLISGASGLIGQALQPFLQTQGWTVDTLVRRPSRDASEIQWDPASGTVTWPEAYHCDAVVHLAGANIAGGRWTAARQQEIRQSRVQGTTTLVQALARLERPPRVLASGSASGFYGDTGDEAVTENAPSGAGFLAEVCQAWEDAARSAEVKGTRLVWLRSGVVLSPAGGALAKMLPAFKAGLGGPVGSGQQWLSWIGLPDWLHACQRVLEDPALSGPVNLTAPRPERQRDFARILGEVINRPTGLPAPATVLRLALGQMADEVLLASSRVHPDRLLQSGYDFMHPSLENALRHVLGKAK